VTWENMDKTWRRDCATCTGESIAGLPSETITESLDPEKRWKATTIGIAALEDKVVQYAVGTVLNQIWKRTFWVFRMDSGRGGASTMRWTHSTSESHARSELVLDLTSGVFRQNRTFVDDQIVEHRIETGESSA